MGGPTYQSTPPAYLTGLHWHLLDGTTATYNAQTASNEKFPSFDSITATGLELNFSFFGVLNDIYAAGSPFANAAAYDPSGDLMDAESALLRYELAVDGFDPQTTWSTILDLVEGEADRLYADDSTNITNLVSAYEARTAPSFNRSINRVTGGFFMENAAEGTGLMMALAMLERGRTAELSEVEQNLIQQNAERRAAFITNQLAGSLQYELNRISAEQNLYAVKADLATRTIVANKEFQDEELELAYKDAMWSLELFQQASGVLGATNGAPLMQRGPSKAMTALSAALSIGGLILPFVL
jgi:hypothetical protein